jgi:hypothetical protein
MGICIWSMHSQYKHTEGAKRNIRGTPSGIRRFSLNGDILKDHFFPVPLRSLLQCNNEICLEMSEGSPE